jgi:hypothetical protein
MKIKVTQEHINSGVQINTRMCPIALAIHETFPNIKKVEVGCDNVEIFFNDGAWESYTLPLEAEKFVDWFDQGGMVRPFEFSLGFPNSTSDKSEEELIEA